MHHLKDKAIWLSKADPYSLAYGICVLDLSWATGVPVLKQLIKRLLVVLVSVTVVMTQVC